MVEVAQSVSKSHGLEHQGGMYTLSPNEVNADLSDRVVIESGQHSFNLVMIEDVPASTKDRRAKVG